MRRAIAALVASVMCLTACGGDDDDERSAAASSSSRASASTTTSVGPATTTTATTTSNSTAPGTTPAAPTTPCPAPPGGTTDPTDSPTGSGLAYLTDVRLTAGDCTDSVVFTFDAAAATGPAYRVEYQAGPIMQDPTGDPLPVAGGAFLVVTFQSATGFNVDTGQETYTGETRLSAAGARFVTEVVQSGDFEALLTWVIGVDEVRRYTVTADGTTTRTIRIDLR